MTNSSRDTIFTLLRFGLRALPMVSNNSQVQSELRGFGLDPEKLARLAPKSGDPEAREGGGVVFQYEVDGR